MSMFEYVGMIESNFSTHMPMMLLTNVDGKVHGDGLHILEHETCGVDGGLLVVPVLQGVVLHVRMS